MARWDSPLFTVSSSDELPLEAIWQTIMTGAKAPTNVAVLQVCLFPLARGSIPYSRVPNRTPNLQQTRCRRWKRRARRW